jgi:outer membrane protein assembly factor BamD (BamD/ComL family)
MQSKRMAVALLSLALMLGSCGKKAQVRQPPRGDSFRSAEAYYMAGDYAQAVPAYEAYLKQERQDHREQALLHLALSYSLGGDSPEQLARAQALLGQVIREYPAGAAASEARLLLQNLTVLEELQASRKREEERLRQLSADIATLMQRVTELEKQRESESSDPLRKAAGLVRDGMLKEAAAIYTEYLASPEASLRKDEAAFRLALIELTPDSGVQDARAALGLLQRIGRDWPQSPYAAQARYLLSVHRELTRLRSQVQAQQAELKQLDDELKALKDIDLKKR